MYARPWCAKDADQGRPEGRATARCAKDADQGRPEGKGHTPVCRRTSTGAGRSGRATPRCAKDVLPWRAGRERVLGPNILID